MSTSIVAALSFTCAALAALGAFGWFVAWKLYVESVTPTPPWSESPDGRRGAER